MDGETNADPNPLPSRPPDELTFEEFPLLMAELRGLAKRLLDGDPGATLSPGATMQNALRRVRFGDPDDGDVTWENRTRFFAAMRRAMKRAWLEHVRTDRPAPDDSDAEVDVSAITLDPSGNPEVYDAEMAGLYHALDRLEEVATDDDIAIANYRIFCGLAVEEVARMMEMDGATVDQHWCFIRAYLHRQMVLFLEKD